MIINHQSMRNPFKIFGIRRDERWMAVVLTCVFALLNALLIYNHYGRFTLANHGHVGAYSLFNNKLFFSGYDPYAYMTLTKYSSYYVLDRHPLYTLLLYPFAWLNHLIMTTFNFNAAMFIMAVLVVLAATYSALFMYRTLHEVMSLGRADSRWLTALLFSFAAIMTASMSPDHFIFSLFLLVLTVYVLGRSMAGGRAVAWWKAAVLYFFTAGITLTNGLKSLLGVWFTDGRSTFKPKNVVLVLLLPSALLLGSYALQYEELLLPRMQESDKIMKKAEAKDPYVLQKDSLKRQANQKITGKPISNEPFLKWIDTSSSRVDGIVEGLFGESIALHKDYLLGDIYLGRPLVVRYHNPLNYIINGLVVLLFMAGIVVGIRRRVILMLLSWFGVDVFIHVVLGFGINEVYINGTHWMFFIPIAIACLYRLRMPERALQALRLTVMAITIFLWSYNSYLIASYMLG